MLSYCNFFSYNKDVYLQVREAAAFLHHGSRGDAPRQRGGEDQELSLHGTVRKHPGGIHFHSSLQIATSLINI